MSHTLILDPWQGKESATHTSGEDLTEISNLRSSQLFDLINSILGYDIFQAQLIAEGYREFAQESLRLADGTAEAFYEILLPE